MVILEAFEQVVRIDEGELTGYVKEGHEYIHQKGSPGWRSSDTEMFPVIGPTGEVDFKVQTPKGDALQDQHGLLRELEYRLISASDTRAVLQKKYEAGTEIRNSKYPKKSSKEWVHWPYDFDFQKTFELRKDGLEITFKIQGEVGMPFMLGYHPAFKLYLEAPTLMADTKEITLAEVLAVGNRAFQIANCNTIRLRDKKNVQISTEGFGHFMLWTEVPNMICIEPITFYPYEVAQGNLHQGFQHLTPEPREFKVKIEL